MDIPFRKKKPKVDDIVSPKSAYAQMKMNFQAKSTLQKKDFTVKKADSLDYGEGDTVRHVKFGVGIVKNIADGGRDYEVTVDFDKVGVKKNCSPVLPKLKRSERDLSGQTISAKNCKNPASRL